MLAKVWNKNVHPFSQDYKGEKIFIPAGGYIDMDYHDAIQFKSTYYPPEYDASKNQLETSYKMIVVEPYNQGQAPDPESIQAFRSHLDGSLHMSKEALAAHDADLTASAPKDADGAAIVSRSPGRPRKDSGVVARG